MLYSQYLAVCVFRAKGTGCSVETSTLVGKNVEKHMSHHKGLLNQLVVSQLFHCKVKKDRERERELHVTLRTHLSPSQSLDPMGSTDDRLCSVYGPPCSASVCSRAAQLLRPRAHRPGEAKAADGVLLRWLHVMLHVYVFLFSSEVFYSMSGYL